MLQQIALWKIETLVDVKRQKQPPGKGGGGGVRVFVVLKFFTGTS